MSAIQEDFASRGQRVLLFAKKVISSADLSKEAIADTSLLEDRLIAVNINLIVVGLIALVDPPRDDTTTTVSVCRRAGIRFAMVTGEFHSTCNACSSMFGLAGDFALTATAIAHQVGIITNPISAVKHIGDLPHDIPLDQVPDFDNSKEEGDAMTSLVLSGSEMMTMTESQWKQVLSVSYKYSCTVFLFCF
jgi:sodium/potassium-transporting ATPase subunit alpha